MPSADLISTALELVATLVGSKKAEESAVNQAVEEYRQSDEARKLDKLVALSRENTSPPPTSRKGNALIS